MIAIQYNLRSLFVRRLTAAATLGGVALVTFVLAGALMLAAGAERAMASVGRDDVAIVLRAGSDSELASSVDTASLQTLRAAPAVTAPSGEPSISPELVSVVALQKSDGSGLSNLTVRGVEERAFALRPQLRLVSGRQPRPGSDEALVGKRIVGKFAGLTLASDGSGGEVRLGKNRPVRVVGVFQAPGDSAESELWVIWTPRARPSGAPDWRRRCESAWSPRSSSRLFGRPSRAIRGWGSTCNPRPRFSRLKPAGSRASSVDWAA